MFSDFTREKNVCSKKWWWWWWWGMGLASPLPPPFSTTLFQNKNTYECNFNLIVDNSHLFNSNMRIGTYLDQTLTIMQ